MSGGRESGHSSALPHERASRQSRGRVLLIYPSSFPDVPGADFEFEQFKFIPNGVLCLGSFLKREGFEVRLLDCRLYPKADIEETVRREAPGCLCVGVSAMTGQLRHGLALADVVKTTSGVPVVWGGIHPTLFPEQTLKDRSVDFIIQGEAEYAFLALLTYLAGSPAEVPGAPEDMAGIEGLGFESRGRFVVNPPPASLDVEALPDPDYGLLEMDRYVEREVFRYQGNRKVRGIDIHTSRGCPYRCSFCTNILPAFKRWRALDADRVLKLMEYLIEEHDLEHIWFSDDFFFGSKKRVRAIVDGIVERGFSITWEANARVDNMRAGYLDDELIAKLKASGCTGLRFGVESGSQPILDILKKDITPEEAVHAFEECEEHGIVAEAFFMIAVPGETLEDVAMTVDLILKLHEASPGAILGAPGVFRPYPGTELYDRCRELGFKEPRDLREWAEYDFGDPASNLYIRAEDLPWVKDPGVMVDLGHYVYWYLSSEAGAGALSAARLLGRIAGFRLRHHLWRFRFEPWLVRQARRVARRS